MKTAWVKNLQTDEEKKRFESSLVSARLVLDRLTQLLTEEEEGIDRSEFLIDTYESASWAAKQAHKNGQRAMLQKIKNLINLDQETK